jgi:phosphate starvation-inducible PhoH-like protein
MTMKTNNVRLKSLAKLYKPKSENQREYVAHLSSDATKIVVAVGPAGTGKTLFACNQAVEQLRQSAIEKLIITRPLVAVEEEIGFLPGNLIMKMDPWTRPIFDILLEYYAQKDIDAMLRSGTIEIAPLAYMRGRTFKKAWIVADEMQNSSPSQMLMLMTRLGEGSKLVITGDMKQSDRMHDNGLRDLTNKIQQHRNGTIEGIGYVELEVTDVERSPIVRRVLELYETKTVSKSTRRIVPKNETSIIKSNTNQTTVVPKTKDVSVQDAAIIPRSLIPKHESKPEMDFKPKRW